MQASRQTKCSGCDKGGKVLVFGDIRQSDASSSEFLTDQLDVEKILCSDCLEPEMIENLTGPCSVCGLCFPGKALFYTCSVCGLPVCSQSCCESDQPVVCLPCVIVLRRNKTDSC